MIDYCGYLNRDGNFIDCSQEKARDKHGSYASKYYVDEEFLLSELGWVKLCPSLVPGKYVYTCMYPLSAHQTSWLKDNGYDVDLLDIEELI